MSGTDADGALGPLRPHGASPDPGPPAACRAGASVAWDILYAVGLGIGFPYLLWRRWARGKDKGTSKQKLGHIPARDPGRARIWIHAVSVGEVRAAEPLCQALDRELPEVEIVISTTTGTGQEVARQLRGAERVFYYPYDFSRAVRRAFERARPTVAALMELEVWPNFTAEAAARGVPVVVVNGRITERAARRYRLAGPLLRPSFRRVRRWLMQNEEYAQRIRELGVEPQRLEVAGNIKYDAIDTRLPAESQRADARRSLGLSPQARVIMGGSTHPGEDEALLDAYLALRAGFPGLHLVLVPRHPHRLGPVEQAIRARGLACLRRSAFKADGRRALDAIPAEQHGSMVVLLDTLGELGRLYCAAEVAFVGGSLIPHGGQNVLEPAGLGLPVIHGPHMHNFADAVQILKDCEGSVQVRDGPRLRDALERLLSDPSQAQAMGQRARAAFLKRQGAAARCVAYLRRLLEEARPGAGGGA